MKKVLSYLVKGVLAGIMIGIGGTIYLSLDNKVLGASLFAIGLFMIVINEFNLYTGKVGYIFDNKPKYLIEVITTVIGNFIGTFSLGYVLRFTRIYTAINEKAVAMTKIKLDDSMISILILSIMCGMLMYLAVNGYKVMKDNFARYASVFLCVIVFILCSFEHSIANMYYFSVANIWSRRLVVYLLIMIAGNGIGGVFIPLLTKLKNYLEKKK